MTARPIPKRARDRDRIRHEGPPSTRKGETADQFETRLADQIRKYWRGHGGDGGLIIDRKREGFRSNMRNGVPPGSGA